MSSDRNQLCPTCAEKEVPPPPDRPWHWPLVIFAPRFWLAIGELLISPKAIAMYRSWKERSLPTDDRLLELTEFFQQSSVECRRETQRLRQEYSEDRGAWAEAKRQLEEMEERFERLLKLKDDQFVTLKKQYDELVKELMRLRDNPHN